MSEIYPQFRAFVRQSTTRTANGRKFVERVDLRGCNRKLNFELASSTFILPPRPPLKPYFSQVIGSPDWRENIGCMHQLASTTEGRYLCSCSIARLRPRLRVIERPSPPTRPDVHSMNGLSAS